MQKYLHMSKKSSIFAPAFSLEKHNPLIGAPANFNLWGEREQGENSYERRSRESY